MKQIENNTKLRNFGFLRSYSRIRPQQLDVESRAELVQDVIDRIVDRHFGGEYLFDLKKLNEKYNIRFKIINGVRIYDHTHSNAVVDDADLWDYSPEDVEDVEIEFHERAALIQDVIDRLIDKHYFESYLTELQKLNKKFPLKYNLRNGVRVYQDKTVTEIPSYLELETDIFIALSDGTKEINNFNQRAKNQRTEIPKESPHVSVPSTSNMEVIWNNIKHPVKEIIESTSTVSHVVYKSFTYHTRVDKLKDFLMYKSYDHHSQADHPSEPSRKKRRKMDYLKRKLKSLMLARNHINVH